MSKKINRWTTVKKTLPPSKGDYLVTILSPQRGFKDGFVTEAFFDGKHFITNTDYGDPEYVKSYGRVIAWMPKPEPFKF
jgi:hypothetical protein